MGNTEEYLDRLTNEVGIAPAASQEELDLAQSLADEFSKNGLKPEVQEFPAQSLANVPTGAMMVLLFVGIIVIGIGAGATTVIGLILVALAIAMLVMTYNGNDILSKIGPRAHSQNVVAIHRAEGEGNERNRPIVILAHYDTPRIDPLSRPQFASFKKYFPVLVPNCVCAVAVCALIQLLVFLPEAARRTFWVIGIIAAVPVLLWGIALIARRFAPYADGAVGNKSSVAALMGVMARVCSGDGVGSGATAAPAEAKQPRTRMVTHEEVEEVIGKRHGEAKLREFGILPESCEITYIEPEVHTYEVEEPVEDDELDDATAEMPALEGEEEAVDDATRPMEIPEDLRADAAPVDSSDATTAIDMSKLVQLEDGETTEEGPLQETDHSGLKVMAEEDPDASDKPNVEREQPEAVNDPAWGQSSYTPTAKPAVSNVARRAALFDLPDISISTDALSEQDIESQGASYGMSAPSAPSVATPDVAQRPTMAQRLAEASERMAAAPSPVRLDEGEDPVQFVASAGTGAPIQDEIEVLSAPVSVEPAEKKRRFGLFGRKKKQQQDSMSGWLGVDDDFDAKKSGEKIGSWDNFDSDEGESSPAPKRGHWKGGAARSINLRESLGKLPGFGGSDKPEDVADEAEPLDAGATVMMPEMADPSEYLPVEDTQTEPQDEPVLDDEEGLFKEVSFDGEPVEAEPEYEGELVEGEPFEGEQPAEEEAFAGEGDDVFAAEDLEDENFKAPVDRELRDAILAMSDDELKKHDIWFVATGASELNHAGVNEFVAEHRKDLRGAFIINLESVGAGDLTLLSYEGFGRTRRADRRLLKLLSGVASDIHLSLDQMKRTWTDTEATPCMRRSLRAVTIMGMGDNELPAYSATDADAPEAVDADQVLDVVAIVTEAIRRS